MNILVAYQRQAAWLFRGTHTWAQKTGWWDFVQGHSRKHKLQGGPAGSHAVTEVTITGLMVSCWEVHRAQVT
jgi:hypothetical protein